jgi:excisionase family DNA binding protein
MAPNTRDDRPEDNVEPVALGVPAGARTLGIGTTKFRELIASGELKAIRIDRRVLVPRSEIDRYVARKLKAS